MNNIFVPSFIFWKRERFSSQSPKSLPQGIIPSFHMISLTWVFANTLMSLLRKDLGVGLPEITKTKASSISFRDFLPEFSTGFFATVAINKSDNLPSSTTECGPCPDFITTLFNVTADFVQFQYVIKVSRIKLLTHFWQLVKFFLTTLSGSDVIRQKYVIHPANSLFPDTFLIFLPDALHYNAPSVLILLRLRSPCSDIAVSRKRCVHSWRCSHYRSSDIYVLLLFLSSA